MTNHSLDFCKSSNVALGETAIGRTMECVLKEQPLQLICIMSPPAVASLSGCSGWCVCVCVCDVVAWTASWLGTKFCSGISMFETSYTLKSLFKLIEYYNAAQPDMNV